MNQTKNTKPLVTVICITYNQASYIRETLDSFMMQLTDFKFEVLVHDDASTDGTTEIIKEYAKKFPEIIKPLYEKKNQYSQGNLAFLRDMFNMAKGKYIAECEGDDFWTDENKLQVQVDFMESHPECAICFHPVRVFFEKNAAPDYIYPEEKNPQEFDTKHLLKNNFIQTNAVMYRNQGNYKDLSTNMMPLDWYTHLYHAKLGAIGFVDKVMSAYRRHPGGLWWDSYKHPERIMRKYAVEYFNFNYEVGKLFEDNPEYLGKIIESMGYLLEQAAANDRKYPGDETVQKIYTKLPLAINWLVAKQAELLHGAQAEMAAKQSEFDERVGRLEKELKAIKTSKTWRLRGAAVKAIGKKSV